MTLIAPTLQAFFTDRLTRQRQASPRTIAVLPRHAAAAARLRPRAHRQAALRAGLGRPRRAADRRRSSTTSSTTGTTAPRTRNLRLTAIRSLFSLRRAAPSRARRADRTRPGDPAETVRQTDRDLPHRRRDRRADRRARPATAGKADATAPMLTLAVHTGLRVSELIGLNCGDVDPRHRRARPLPKAKAASNAPSRSPPTPKRVLARLARRTRRPPQTTRCSRPAPAGASAATPSSAASAPTPRPPRSAAHRSRASASIRTCSGTAARCRCCKPASTPP